MSYPIIIKQVDGEIKNQLTLQQLSEKPDGRYPIYLNGKSAGVVTLANGKVIIKMTQQHDLTIVCDAPAESVIIKSAGVIHLDGNLEAKKLSISAGTVLIRKRVTAESVEISAVTEFVNEDEVKASKIKVNAPKVTQRGQCRATEKLKIYCKDYHSEQSAVMTSGNKLIFVGEQVDAAGNFSAKGVAFFSANNITVNGKMNLPGHTLVEAKSMQLQQQADVRLNGEANSAALTIQSEINIAKEAKLSAKKAAISAALIRNQGKFNAEQSAIVANRYKNRGRTHFSQADIHIKTKMTGKNAASYRIDEGSVVTTRQIKMKGDGGFSTNHAEINANTSTLGANTNLTDTTFTANYLEQGGVSRYLRCKITYKKRFQVVPQAEVVASDTTLTGGATGCDGSLQLTNHSTIESQSVDVDGNLGLSESGIYAERILSGKASTVETQQGSVMVGTKQVRLAGDNKLSETQVAGDGIALEGTNEFTNVELQANDRIRLGKIEGDTVKMAAHVIDYMDDHHLTNATVCSTLHSQQGEGSFKGGDIRAKFDSIAKSASVSYGEELRYHSQFTSSEGQVAFHEATADIGNLYLQDGLFLAEKTGIKSEGCIRSEPGTQTTLTNSMLSVNSANLTGSVKASNVALAATNLTMSGSNSFEEVKIDVEETLVLDGKQVGDQVAISSASQIVTGELSLQNNSTAIAEKSSKSTSDSTIDLDSSRLQSGGDMAIHGGLTAKNNSSVMAEDVTLSGNVAMKASSISAENTVGLRATSRVHLENGGIGGETIDSGGRLTGINAVLEAQKGINFQPSSLTVSIGMHLKSDNVHVGSDAMMVGKSLMAKSSTFVNQGSIDLSDMLKIDSDYIANDNGVMKSGGSIDFTSARAFANLFGQVSAKNTKITALASTNVGGSICGQDSLSVNTLFDVNAGCYISYNTNLNSIASFNMGLILPTLPSKRGSLLSALIPASKTALMNFIPQKAKLIDFTYRALPLAWQGVKAGVNFGLDVIDIARSEERQWGELLPSMPTLPERLVDTLEPLLSVKNMAMSASGAYQSMSGLTRDDFSLTYNGLASGFHDAYHSISQLTKEDFSHASLRTTYHRVARQVGHVCHRTARIAKNEWSHTSFRSALKKVKESSVPSMAMSLIGPSYTSSAVVNLNAGLTASNNSTQFDVYSINAGADVALNSTTHNTFFSDNWGYIAANQVNMIGREGVNHGHIYGYQRVNANYRRFTNEDRGHIEASYGAVFIKAEQGRLDGTIKGDKLGLDIHHLDNAEDIIAGTGKGANIQATTQFSTTIDEDLTITQANHRDCSVSVTARAMTIATDQNVNGNAHYEASKGDVNLNANVHANKGLVVKAGHDVNQNGQRTSAGENLNIIAQHSVYNNHAVAYAGKDLYIHAIEGQAINTAGVWQGGNYAQVVGKTGVSNLALEHDVRVRFDNMKTYETGKIIGGKGEGHGGIGTYVYTEGKYISDASDTLGIGDTIISADMGVDFRARTHTYLKDDYVRRTGWFHQNKKHVREYDTQVEKSTVGSAAGKVRIYSKHGSVTGVSVNTASAMGTTVYAEGKVAFYDYVAEHRVIEENSKWWGLTKDKEGYRNQYSVPTVLASHGNITVFSLKDGVYLRGVDVMTPMQFTAVGDSVTIAASKLEQSYWHSRAGFDTSIFGQSVYASNARRQFSPLPFMSTDATFERIRRLANSNGRAETLLNTASAATNLANTANQITQGIRNHDLLRAGLNHYGLGDLTPSAKLTIAHEREHAKSQSVGAGSVNAGSMLLQARHGDVEFDGVGIWVNGDAEISADRFIQRGMKLTSERTFESESFGIGVSGGTGIPTDVSASHSRSHEERNDYYNQHMHIGGHLSLQARKWLQDGANAEIGSLSGHVDEHEIITHLSDYDVNSLSYGASTDGNFNASNQRTHARFIAETSGLTVGGLGGTAESNAFTVGVLHNKGGVIDLNGQANYHADHVVNEDVHESIVSKGFSLSGNMNDFLPRQAEPHHVDAKDDEGKMLQTANIGMTTSSYQADQHAAVLTSGSAQFSANEVSGTMARDEAHRKTVTKNEAHEYEAEVPILDEKTLSQMRDNLNWISAAVSGRDYHPTGSLSAAILSDEKFNSLEELEAYSQKIRDMEALSEAVYGDDTIPAGYREVDEGFENEDTDTNVTAYVNDRSGQIIFAFRGTEGITNLVKDDGDIARGNLPRSFDRGMQAYIDRTMQQYSNYNVAFTGHSLGAALASMASDRYGRPAYTFDNPGIYNPNHQFDLSKVTSFQGNKNIVNQGGRMTGRQYDQGHVVQLSQTNVQRVMAEIASRFGAVGSMAATTYGHRLPEIKEDLNDYLSKQREKARRYQGQASSPTLFRPAPRAKEPGVDAALRLHRP